MKLKFDSSQAFQLDAVKSFIDLFDGQPLQADDFSIDIHTSTEVGQSSVFQTELGFGNNLTLSSETLLKNLNAVQERNDLDITTGKEFLQNGLNFSVEMETGTGKTYVYLRTIFEMNQKYGFKKFIIVVPSVAIREGALKNLEITSEHFKALYNNIAFEYFLYDSKKASRLRQFATSNQLQIMVINIDAFNKDSNIFNKELDKLNGLSPKDFIEAVKPILIIDEPQSVDNTAKAQEAIKSLNPLVTFRFSATHKNPYNLIYKLDPIKAYELRLVKQITVASVLGENTNNDAYVKLLGVNNKSGLVAKVRIQVQGKTNVTEQDLEVKLNYDLFVRSKERAVYENGFQITTISAELGNEFIDFNSGKRLYLGEELGGIADNLFEMQIEATIKKHLDKELQLGDRGIKVLSLFFVDKVSNYRLYDANGKPTLGKFAEFFEKHYLKQISKPKYSALNTFDVEKIHDGYFSMDKKSFKDTSGKTAADEDTYALIMKDKEKLLSLNEPLKFIFSHSALREGWDNPNVFQICMLREVGSSNERRQTIGRGLRLPVNQNGERIKDDNINKLTVIAQENYADFAKGLQKEYEDDKVATFGKVPSIAFNKIVTFENDIEKPFTRIDSENIWKELISSGMINESGKILSAFQPQANGFSLKLSEAYASQENEIIAIVKSYQLNQFIKEDKPAKEQKINKQIFSSPEFEALWNKIKYKTTYRVNYSTPDLIQSAAKEIAKMERIDPIKILYNEAKLDINKAGISAEESRVSYQAIPYASNLPDILAYLQKETELTRTTLVKILTESKRLKDFAINPQKFMDRIAIIILRELHKITIDGIQYEKISVGDTEWRMDRFEDKELKQYFQNSIKSTKSVFENVIYDSEVERLFAAGLEKRDDIKLFVKLPSFFKVETPVGTYNPDWAIVKQFDETVYLVRETKGTRDESKLRISENDKIKCGRKHFEALDTDFDVVVNASKI